MKAPFFPSLLPLPQVLLPRWVSESGIQVRALLSQGNTRSPHLKQLDFSLFECRKPNYTLVNSLQSTKHRKKTVTESKRPEKRKESLRPNESKLNTSPQKCQTFLLAQNKA